MHPGFSPSGAGCVEIYVTGGWLLCIERHQRCDVLLSHKQTFQPEALRQSVAVYRQGL